MGLRLSEWRTKFLDWLNDQIVIDSWILDVPSRPGETTALLPPLTDIDYTHEGGPRIVATATQDLYILRSYPSSLKFADLPLNDIQGTYQTLSIRLLHDYGEISEDLTLVDIQEVGDPVHVMPVDKKQDWVIRLHWSFRITFDALPETGSVEEPFPVNGVNFGVWRSLVGTQFENSKLDLSYGDRSDVPPGVPLEASALVGAFDQVNLKDYFLAPEAIFTESTSESPTGVLFAVRPDGVAYIAAPSNTAGVYTFPIKVGRANKTPVEYLFKVTVTDPNVFPPDAPPLVAPDTTATIEAGKTLSLDLKALTGDLSVPGFPMTFQRVNSTIAGQSYLITSTGQLIFITTMSNTGASIQIPYTIQRNGQTATGAVNVTIKPFRSIYYATFSAPNGTQILAYKPDIDTAGVWAYGRFNDGTQDLPITIQGGAVQPPSGGFMETDFFLNLPYTRRVTMVCENFKGCNLSLISPVNFVRDDSEIRAEIYTNGAYFVERHDKTEVVSQGISFPSVDGQAVTLTFEHTGTYLRFILNGVVYLNVPTTVTPQPFHGRKAGLAFYNGPTRLKSIRWEDATA